MRTLFLNLSVALLALLFALGAAEVGTRLLAPQQLIVHRPDIYQPSDLLGARHRPGINTTINTGEGTVRFRTDRRGFRVGDAGEREAAHRVLLLGDSFMEALAVDYDSTLGGRLEQRLPGVLGKDVVVRNTGVGGWDPRQYLVQAGQALEEETYDLVLVAVFPANDVVFPMPANTPAPGIAAPTSRSGWSRAYRGVAKPVNDFLRSRSHFFNLLKNGVEPQLVRAGLLHRPRYEPELFSRDTVLSPAWAEAADQCAEIARVARAKGVPTLFVVIPLALEVDPRLFRAYTSANGLDPGDLRTDKANALMTRLLKERGLTTIDAQPALQRAQAAGLNTYGRVDPHLSAAGHDVLARLLAPEVVRAIRTPTASDPEPLPDTVPTDVTG